MRKWMGAVGVTAALALFGCEVDVRTDRETAREVERTGERTEGDLEQAGDRAEGELEQAGRELDEAAGEAGREVGRGLERAGEKIEETFGGSGGQGEWDERPDTPRK